MATSCPEAAAVTWTVLKSSASDRCWTWRQPPRLGWPRSESSPQADGRAARAVPAQHQRPRGGDGRDVHDRGESRGMEVHREIDVAQAKVRPEIDAGPTPGTARRPRARPEW